MVEKKKPKDKREGGNGSRLRPDKIHRNELALLKVLAGAEDGKLSIKDAAETAWPKKGSSGDTEKGKPISAYRRAINACRRLHVRGLISLPERGVYRITADGRRFLEKCCLEASAEPKPKAKPKAKPEEPEEPKAKPEEPEGDAA